jgi:hypothetical protein
MGNSETLFGGSVRDRHSDSPVLILAIVRSEPRVPSDLKKLAFAPSLTFNAPFRR